MRLRRSKQYGLFSGCLLCALVIWAALLFRMVTSVPSSSGLHQHVPPCSSTARVLWAPRVVLRHTAEPSAVHIDAVGRVVKAWVCARDQAQDYADLHGMQLEECAEDEVISPGLVDAAAHLAEWLEPPGRSYEGFASGTQAAAAGGVTTVVDLPANAKPVTTTVARLDRKVDATRGRLHVDVGFWAAALPESLDVAELSAMLTRGTPLCVHAAELASQLTPSCVCTRSILLLHTLCAQAL